MFRIPLFSCLDKEWNGLNLFVLRPIITKIERPKFFPLNLTMHQIYCEDQ